MNPQPLGIERYRHIIILTGAGVSVASGLPVYRGPGGLWQDDLAWVADGANLPGSLPQIWKTFGGLRQRALEAQPNAAHRAIAALQQSATEGQTVTLLTQNVDGLHARAGSPAIELHGSLHRTRCTNPQCDLPPFADVDAHSDAVPLCPRCGAGLRPDVVLFNEPLPVDAEWGVKRALRTCDLFIAVGTSGTVSPASNYARGADYSGARTLLVNLTPMLPSNPYFHEEHLGPAETLLPLLFKR